MRRSAFVSSAAGVAVCLLLVAARTHAVAGVQGEGPGPLRRGSVKQLAAGKMLVAARRLPDPNFAETIVLLTEYSQKGAIGMIVNRRTDLTLARIAPGLEPAPGRSPLVFFGGPVAVPGVLALVRAKSAPPDTRRVAPGVYLVDTREVLEKMIAASGEPDRLRLYVGYSGWGEGQLEEETARGAWHVVDGDANVIFDPKVESAWERQIQRTEALQASNRRNGRSSAGANLPEAAAP